METIYACIDGQPSTGAVVDGAIWAASMLAAPLQFLRVLKRHPSASADAMAHWLRKFGTCASALL